MNAETPISVLAITQSTITLPSISSIMRSPETRIWISNGACDKSLQIDGSPTDSSVLLSRNFPPVSIPTV